MISIPKQRMPRGFSLLEVLVAVVILSVGLLALASLQLSMIRASADSKAQTVAAGLAKARIESLRSYRSLDAYRTLVASTGEAAVTTLADSGGDLGGVTFTRTTTVNRFVYEKVTGAFVNVSAVFTVGGCGVMRPIPATGLSKSSMLVRKVSVILQVPESTTESVI